MTLPKAKAQEQATDAQTQRLASLGFMLASVCHELSNPLAAIHSMLQILQSKRGVTPETMDKGLASISQNIARVLAITRKLGDFSRVGADAPQPVRVDASMEAAVWLVHHSEQAPRVTVEYRGAPGAQVVARAGQLEQVFYNVMLNAAQAGGSRIEAQTRVAAAKCIVTIADDGPGIPAAHLERVFDPFFSTKSPGGGTGLGLAICYELVHEMGGAIRASNGERGACFEIELPA
jgi:C4-dicarboxylate-specific signal transduction histidine kinase